MFLCFSSVIRVDHSWLQNVVRTRSGWQVAVECVTNALTSFWHLLWSITKHAHCNMDLSYSIYCNKEPKQFYWWCHLCICPPPTDPICHLCQGAVTWFVLSKQGTILSCVQSWYFLAGLFFHFSNCSNCIVIGPHRVCVSSTKWNEGIIK